MSDDLRVIYPRLNHGRWIVDCPDCLSAQVADLAAPYVFVCAECLDAATGRGIAGVRPNAELVAAVEARTSHRPDANRNWTPGEAIATLELENRLNGYPSEAGGFVVAPDGGGLERRL